MSILRPAVILIGGCAVIAGVLPAPVSAAPIVAPTAKPAPKHPYFTPKPSTKVIASPRQGAKITSHTVQVRVPDRFAVQKARLNATRLTAREFVRDGRFWVLRASASHGLRHDANRLVVVARNETTHLLTTQTVRFQLPRKKPLTGAGRDVFSAAGSALTIRGITRLHPAVDAARRPSLRWSVVRAPGAKPTLRKVGDRAVRLRTSKPGVYTLKATGSYRGVRTTDTVTATVATPPMVNLNTEATQNGVRGIAVGDRFFGVDPQTQSLQWQVLILDRATAGLVSNTSYGSCVGSNSMCAYTADGVRKAWIPDDLARLVPPDGDSEKSTRLVIVAGHQGGRSVHDPTEMFKSIGISASFPKRVDDGRVHAVIGVPGMAAGQAVSNDEGPLPGFLLLGPGKKFAYSSADRSSFVTRAGDDCDTRTPCSVRTTVAGKDVTVDSPEGGGFTVGVFDARTLVATQLASIDVTGSPKVVSDGIDTMIDFLADLPEESLVVVNSSGPVGAARMDPFGFDYDRPSDERDRSRALAEAIEDLGGTGHEFLQSTRRLPDGTSGGDYTLIGWPGAGKGNGRQLRGMKASLRGVLVRGNESLYRPVNVSESDGGDSEKLQEILYTPQGAKPWPGDDDPEFQKALRYLVSDVIADPQIGSDIRGAYWSSYPRGDVTGGLDGRFWVDLADSSKLTGTLSVPTGQDFSQKTLNAVRDQLVQEFRWVGYTRIYFELMGAPYRDELSNGALHQQLQNIAKNFQVDAASARAKAPVEVDWTAIVTALLHVTSVLLAIFLPGSELITAVTEEALKELIELSFATVSAAVEIGGTSVEAANKHYEAQDEIDEQGAYEVKAGNLTAEILDGFKQTTEVMNIQGDVISSDYAKLSAFGRWVTSCVGTGQDPCAKTPLMVAQQLQTTTLEGLERTSKARMYQELVPLAYDVMKIPAQGTYGGYGDPEGNWNPARFACRTYYMFSDDKLPTSLTGKPGDPDYGQKIPLFKPFLYVGRESVSLRDNAVNAPTFQPYVIGIGDDNDWTYPDANEDLGDSLTESLTTMFTPVATDAAWTSDGLGMSQSEFIEEIPQRDITAWNMSSCGGWATGENTVPAPLR